MQEPVKPKQITVI